MGFQYQPLKPNEIRLLKPLSRTASSLSFELVHKSLASTPPYAALSYTWGLPGDVESIVLNGQDFPIRQNLSDALQQINASKLVDRYLWVDAICINQGDDEDALNERSVQITLMKEIYEQAAKILVWLGNPENEANNQLAFPLMKYVEKQYRKVMKNARPYRPWWYQTKFRSADQDTADFLLADLPAKDKKVFDVPGSPAHRAWLGIISLWKKPWWTRTWVFQESTIPEKYTTTYLSGIAVLPFNSKVRFMCGDQATSWQELAVISLVATNMEAKAGVDLASLVGSRNAFNKLLNFRTNRVQNILRSFLHVLQMFRHTECFDPRDKVYAPLCLAPDDVRRFITPDYANNTVLDVYRDVVRYCLTQPDYSLDFLGYVIYQEAQSVQTPQGVRSVLPSWVPNFSSSVDVDPVSKLLHVPEAPPRKGLTMYDRRNIPSNKEGIVSAFKPLGDLPSGAFIEGSSLNVSGVYIDVINDIIPNTGPDLDVVRAVAREKGRKWAIESNHKYFTGESYGDAINRTILLDLVYDGFGRPSERGGKHDSAFLAKPQSELTLVEHRYQMNMRIAKTRGSIMRDLGLSQKRFLLMIPRPTVVGDMIWALSGGRALYILRPVNSGRPQYRFIGECYAHGLMDGDVLRRMKLGEARMEAISLV